MTFWARLHHSAGGRARHAGIKSLAFYIVLSCLYFLPGLASGRVMAVGDGFMQDLPSRALLHSIYREGTLPLWNKFAFSGFPLLGSVQAGAMYPLNIALYFAFHPYTAFDLAVIFHFAMAGWFAHLYLRLIGITFSASLAGGALFAFAGFMPSHLQHVPMHESMAWFPLLLYLTERLVLKPSVKLSASLGMALSMQWLCGSPQTAFYSAGFALFYLACRAFRSERRTASAAFAFGLVSFLLAVLIALPQIVSAYELASLGTRDALSFRTFSEYSMPLKELPGLLFPKLFGIGREGFIGALPLILGIASAIALWRKSPHVRVWGIAAFISLVLSLGDSTPIQRLMFHMPGYNMFRAVSRNLFIFDFSLAVLFAIGLDGLFSGENRQRIIKAGLWASGAFAIFCIAGFAFYEDKAIFAVAAFIGLYALLMFRAGRGGKYPVYVLMLLLVLEIMPTVRRDDFPAARELDSYEAGLFNAIESDSRTSRAALSWGVGNNLWALTRGVEIADGYDPLILSDYSGLLSMNFTGIALWDGLLYSNAELSMLNVRYIAAPQRKSGLVGSIKDRAGNYLYKKAGDFGEAVLYENLRSLPRVYSVTSLVPVAGFKDAVAALRAGGIDPSMSALVYAGDLGNIGRAFFPGGTAEIIGHGHNEVVIKTDFPSGGFAVLADSYYPGWRAYADGKEIQIYRVNAVLRGVAVPPGGRSLVLRYQPAWLYPSMMASGAALSFALFLSLRRSSS